MESICFSHSFSSFLHHIAAPFHFHAPPDSRLGARFRPHRFFVSAKKSEFQDFQGYAKPLRLLPATQGTLYTNHSAEKLKHTVVVESCALYRILLKTSPAYGSELTDMSVGILICFISETGESILQRIPVGSYLRESEDAASEDLLHFRRSSMDEFAFQGPKLGNIEAVWISLESGRWRLGGANLTVINGPKLEPGETVDNSSEYMSVTYDFEAEDILLGEGGDVSMIELRPCKATKYSGIDISQLLNENVTRLTVPGEKVMTNAESMQEYAVLKSSLLLYDAILIFVGTPVASLTAGESSAIAFLTGGIGGFLYLLLLQRSVDGLPAADTPPKKEDDIGRGFGGFKAPLLVMAFAFGFGLATLLVDHGSETAALSPRDIMVGMIGFLACKVSVALAAFKPLPISQKDTD